MHSLPWRHILIRRSSFWRAEPLAGRTGVILRKTETRGGILGLVCSKCEIFKPLSEFHPWKGCKRGTRPDCIECHNVGNKKYYYSNVVEILERTRLYNKTEHRKTYIRKYQAGRARRLRDESAPYPRPFLCEICGCPGKDKKGIVFDHNHETGEFRGWLCNRCNRVLGMCFDSTEILRALASYLEKRGSYARIKRNA
jgi:hypothetical protein